MPRLKSSLRVRMSEKIAPILTNFVYIIVLSLDKILKKIASFILFVSHSIAPYEVGRSEANIV